MNVAVFVLENIILCLIFGFVVFGMLLINPLSFISDYPPEIQEQYYRSQNKENTKKKLTKIMLVKKAGALIVFAFLFAWMAHFAGAVTFLQGLLAAYGYMIILAIFDTCVLDWMLFANIKKVRLPGTEQMDREYRQKWFHVKVLFPAIPIFAIAGVVIALLTTWLW